MNTLNFLHGILSAFWLANRASFLKNYFSCRVIIHFKHLKHELYIKQTKEELGKESPTTYKSGKKRATCSTVVPAKKFKCNSL